MSNASQDRDHKNSGVGGLVLTAGHLRMIWLAVGLIGAIATAGGLKSWQIIQSERTPDDVFEKLATIEMKLRPENVRPDPWTRREALALNSGTNTHLAEIRVELDELGIAVNKLREYLFDHAREHQMLQRGPPGEP